MLWVFIAALGLSQVAVSGAYSVAVHRLLIVVASSVAEHGLEVIGLRELQHVGFSSHVTGSVVVRATLFNLSMLLLLTMGNVASHNWHVL